MLAAASARAEVNRWTYSGPEAGIVRQIAIDPADASHLFAAADALFESRDGGASWSAASNYPWSAWAATFDPSNPSAVYAGGYSGLARSTDGGRSWVLLDTSPVFMGDGEIGVDSGNGSTLYAANSAGVFKSLDAGCSWIPIMNGLPAPVGQFSTASFAIDPKDSSTLYVGGRTYGAYTSVDGGENWTPIFDENWTPIFAIPQVNGVAIDPANSSRLFISMRTFDGFNITGGLFRSTDRGVTWARVSTTPPDVPYDGLTIDPGSPSTIYAVSSTNGVFRSIDGGDSWVSVNQGLIGLAVSSIAWVPGPAAPHMLLAATTGAGVFVSRDSAATWSESNTGLTDIFVPSFSPGPGNVVFAVGYAFGTGVFKSSDSGATWNRFTQGIPSDSRTYSISVDPGDATNVWLGTESNLVSAAGIFHSIDGGATWALSNTGIDEANVRPIVIDPSNSSHLLAGTPRGVYRTTNNGASWAKVGPPPVGGQLASVDDVILDAADPQTVYAVVFGRAVKSTDFGSTWNDFGGLAGQFVFSIAQDQQDPSTFLAGLQGSILKSTDSGVTWAVSSSGLPPGRVVSIRIHPTNSMKCYAGVYFGGTQLNAAAGIFASNDGGATWTPFDRGLQVPSVPLRGIGELALDSAGINLFAATGEGLYRYEFSSTAPPMLATAPTSAPANGGDPIVIYGSGFSLGATVRVGGVAATGIVVASPTRIDAIAPAGVPGAVDLTVFNDPTQFDTLAGGFVYDFLDVPSGLAIHDFVVRLASHRITGGCGSGDFCPESSLTRAQAAVWIESALHGVSPIAMAHPVSFLDVDSCGPFGPFEPFIEQLLADGITAGCGPNTFCPGDGVTRAQMAVFLLRAKNGPTYTPPPCTGIFADVACGGSTPGFAVDWIEQLNRDGIAAGCSASPRDFCPTNPVTRGQAAVLLVQSLGL